jgi:outer membrane protein assembly factor BamB
MRNLILILIFLSCPFTSEAQDGTRWRGPEAKGVYHETGLLEKWPDSGPEILWHFDALGLGFSSPVFAGGKIYLTGMEQSTGYLYCLSIDGKLLWKKSYGPEWKESYAGSRSSPTIAGGKVYIMSAMGRLVCMDAGNGSTLWSKDLIKDFGARNITWGMTENLVVYNDKVICTPGGIRHNIIALNRNDGSLIWSSGAKGDQSAYCSPLLVKLTGRNLFITMTADHIVGLDADKGILLWSYTHTNQYSVHANTPIYSNGHIYCFSGYGRGGVKLKLSADGSSVTRIWTNGSMDSRFGGAVLENGLIYGSGDQNRAWQCIDWETGKMKYSSVEIGKGSVIYADGKLFCYSERGELALMKPLTDEFEVISMARVTLGSGTYWAHPVIHEGKLYIRHGNVLIAYKIK